MRVDIHLFGFPRLATDGRPVEIGLRKALALVALVAEARAPVARDTLAGLLWPEIDQGAARARLRRTLHRLSVDTGMELLSADRVAVALNPDVGFVLDTAEFELACDAKRFDLAATLYTGDFLAGLSLPGCESFEEWAFFRREALRGRLVQALERLAEKSLSAGDGHAALQAALRLLSLDPLSEAAHRQAIRAHLLSGDRHGAERQFEACRKLLAEELGVAPEPETATLLDASGSQAPAATRYTDSGGIHLAWQSVGTGTIDIVFVPGFVSHVERAWEEPRAKRFLTALSRLGRLIFFDRRGVGLSDRVGAAPTVEATADDIATVLDAAGSRRALLFGASEGGPGCIRFAADHPARLAGLVLYGSLARGSWSVDYPHVLNPAQYEAWLRRLVAQWGGPSEIATFAPSLADERQARSWWAGLLRAASSPGAIRGVLEALRDTDVTGLLPHVEVPTLVLHRTGDLAVRIEAGRQLASAIPGARFVELAGQDHWPWAGDQETLIEQIRTFAATL
jgi:DNA-binding SARP family transcriptional activator/pimeloyl-ACP methyl ester carboxylesterase